MVSIDRVDYMKALGHLPDRPSDWTLASYLPLLGKHSILVSNSDTQVMERRKTYLWLQTT